MTTKQPEENPQLHELKERLKQKFTFAQNLISSAQNELFPVINRIHDRGLGYCDHGMILRQEYGQIYDPGLDMVDLLDVDC